MKEHNYKKPIILLDRKVSKLKYIKEKTNFIKIKNFIFQNRADYQMLDEEIIFKKKIDCIIAIGGGTIDFAKVYLYFIQIRESHKLQVFQKI